jgi:hypothetical protein
LQHRSQHLQSQLLLEFQLPSGQLQLASPQQAQQYSKHVHRSGHAVQQALQLAHSHSLQAQDDATPLHSHSQQAQSHPPQSQSPIEFLCDAKQQRHSGAALR